MSTYKCSEPSLERMTMVLAWHGLGLLVRERTGGPHTSTGLPRGTGSKLELEHEWSL